MTLTANRKQRRAEASDIRRRDRWIRKNRKAIMEAIVIRTMCEIETAVLLLQQQGYEDEAFGKIGEECGYEPMAILKKLRQLLSEPKKEGDGNSE
jgi:hypothetical protein